MNNYLLTIIICCLISEYNHAQVGTAVLEGQVYSESQQLLLVSAQLVLKKEGVYHRKIRTDHRGNYNFVNLPAGSYSLWVRTTNHCELEIQNIPLSDSQTIHLDIGLMQSSANSDLPADKLEKVYEAPVYHTIMTDTTTTHEKYKSDIAIIQEVYHANELQIRPPEPESPPLPRHKATNFSRDIPALGKPTGF